MILDTPVPRLSRHHLEVSSPETQSLAPPNAMYALISVWETLVWTNHRLTQFPELTSRNRIFLQTLTLAQLHKKCSAFYGTRVHNSPLLTTILSQINQIFTLPPLISRLHYSLIWSYVILVVPFFQVFPVKFVNISYIFCSCCIPRPY